jgi:hypothetical protein
MGISAFGSWNTQRNEIKTIKMKNKKELIQIDCDIKLATAQSKLKMIESGNSQRYNLDLETVKNMANTYKDEFILIVFYLPVIMAFFGYSDEVLEGFKSLALMPDWFKIILVLLAVTISGMRNIFIKALELLKFGGIRK